MMSRPKDYQDALQPLLEEAYEIGHAKNMALEPEYVGDITKPGYGEKRMIKHVQRQRVIDGIPDWFSRLENKFNQLGINYRKFTAEYNSLKPANMTVLHLGERFNFAYVVLRKMLDDESYLLSYLDPVLRAQAIATEAGVIYTSGTVAYGTETHSFKSAVYISLFNFLWPCRKVIDELGHIEYAGKPKSKAEIKRATGLDNNRLKDMAVNVRKELYDCGIPVKLKRPDKIYLEIDLRSPGN